MPNLLLPGVIRDADEGEGALFPVGVPCASCKNEPFELLIKCPEDVAMIVYPEMEFEIIVNSCAAMLTWVGSSVPKLTSVAVVATPEFVVSVFMPAFVQTVESVVALLTPCILKVNVGSI